MLFTCSFCNKNYLPEEMVKCCSAKECGWCHGDSCWDNTEEDDSEEDNLSTDLILT